MGITERKEREKAGMRRLILDTAMKLFTEDGYEAISMRKIAAVIEYSPASIYTYFADKSDIFFELHNEGFEILFSKQTEVQSISDPAERLVQHGRAYLEFAFENPQYYDLMFIARHPGERIVKNKTWDCGMRSYDLLRKNVQECKNAGFFSLSEVETVAFVLWSSVHGIAALHIRQRLALMELNKDYFNNLISNTLELIRNVIR